MKYRCECEKNGYDKKIIRANKELKQTLNIIGNYPISSDRLIIKDLVNIGNELHAIGLSLLGLMEDHCVDQGSTIPSRITLKTLGYVQECLTVQSKTLDYLGTFKSSTGITLSPNGLSIHVLQDTYLDLSETIAEYRSHTTKVITCIFGPNHIIMDQAQDDKALENYRVPNEPSQTREIKERG